MIKVIGIGIRAGDVSVRGAEAIRSADVVIVKTAFTSTYTYFKNIEHVTLDELFEKAGDFEELNRIIVDKIIELSENKNSVYCVHGSACDDDTVKELKKRIAVEIIPSVSFATDALTRYVSDSYVSYSASEYKSMIYNAHLPLVVKEVDSRLSASDLKLKISEFIEEEREITVIDKDGEKTVKLYELDRLDNYDYSTTVLIEPKPFTDKTRYTFDDLVDIMHRLRAPDGCPWDKAQTHKSIRANLIEECYELIEGIDKDDRDIMREETGDVILQALFHMVIGEDTGEFTIGDVISELCAKLVGRHTHIFGTDKVSDADGALSAWERAKSKEKKYTCVSDKMCKISRSLPALMRAAKVQKAAVKAGFEWDSIDGALDKLDEEKEEVRRTVTQEEAFEECGDLLFACLNVLRFKRVEPEEALTFATDKFVRRYTRMEELAKADGIDIATLNVNKQQTYWEKVKAEEKA